MTANQDFSALFDRPGGGNPYRENAYCVLALEPGPLLLRQIISAAQKREVQCRLRGCVAPLVGNPLAIATIAASRAALEDPNHRIAESLLRHRPHRSLQEALQRRASARPQLEIVEQALALLLPIEVANVEVHPDDLEREVLRATGGPKRTAILQALAGLLSSTSADREVIYRRVHKRLSQLREPELHAAALCVRGRIEIALRRMAEANATAEELTSCAASPAERRIASAMQMALHKLRAVGILPVALESICRLVRSDSAQDVRPLLHAFLRHEPNHARAHFLLGVCAFAKSDLAVGLSALRRACNAAEGSHDLECVRVIHRVVRSLVPNVS